MPPEHAVFARCATLRLPRIPTFATQTVLFQSQLPQALPSTTTRPIPRSAWEEEEYGGVREMVA
jgi:hypothetical protein